MLEIIAEKAILEKSISNEEILNHHKDDIFSIINNINFDCTPNWGIIGVTKGYVPQKNRYINSGIITRELVDKRFKNIDKEELKKMLEKGLKDMNIIHDEKIDFLGFSLYGSYLYGDDDVYPNDLDLIVIVGNKGYSLDALRVYVDNLNSILLDKTTRKFNQNFFGVTLISSDLLHEQNKNFVVNDAALLDISTGFSIGDKVHATPLPDFVLNHNMQKMVRWGVSSLLDDDVKIAKRLIECLAMRTVLSGKIKYDNYTLDSTELLKSNTIKLLGYSKEVMEILKGDEMRIRNSIIQNLDSYIANRLGK